MGSSVFMTVRQREFISKLLTERDVSTLSPDTKLVVEAIVNNVGAKVGQASAVISVLLSLPKLPNNTVSQNDDLVTEPGMYQTEDGTLYRVIRSRLTQKLYAKRLIQKEIINGDRLHEPSNTVVHYDFVFEYAPDAIRKLRASHRLTLEKAKEFGIKYGVCCVCGATLKDAESVREGIGPICAKRV